MMGRLADVLLPMPVFTDKQTNSIEQWFSRSYRYEASQEMPYILWNLEIHYHIHKSLPLVLPFHPFL